MWRIFYLHISCRFASLNKMWTSDNDLLNIIVSIQGLLFYPNTVSDIEARTSYGFFWGKVNGIFGWEKTGYQVGKALILQFYLTEHRILRSPTSPHPSPQKNWASISSTWKSELILSRRSYVGSPVNPWILCCLTHETSFHIKLFRIPRIAWLGTAKFGRNFF